MNLKFNWANKNPFLECLIVFIAFNLIFFYLYWRITKKQYTILLLPEEIEKHFGVFLYYFLASSFILLLVLLTLYVKKRLNAGETNNKDKKIGFLSNLLTKFDRIVTFLNIFYKAYTSVFHFVKPIHMQHVVTYVNKILSYSKLKNHLILLIFVVLPRILILGVFLYEIYNQSLHFYFFSLLLLLIPLFFRFILFVYSDIDKQVLPKLNELVERAPTPEKITLTINGKTETFGTLAYRFKPQFAYAPTGERMDLNHFMVNLYNPMLFIGPHMEIIIMPLYSKYTIITVLTYLTIQVMGWGYILFFI